MQWSSLYAPHTHYHCTHTHTYDNTLISGANNPYQRPGVYPRLPSDSTCRSRSIVISLFTLFELFFFSLFLFYQAVLTFSFFLDNLYTSFLFYTQRFHLNRCCAYIERIVVLCCNRSVHHFVPATFLVLTNVLVGTGLSGIDFVTFFVRSVVINSLLNSIISCCHFTWSFDWR